MTTRGEERRSDQVEVEWPVGAQKREGQRCGQKARSGQARTRNTQEESDTLSAAEGTQTHTYTLVLSRTL